MLDCGIHVQPLRLPLFAGDDDVDVVLAAQAVIRHRQQAVDIGRQVNARDRCALVQHHVQETRILHEPDVAEMQDRYQEHRRMIKHSTLYNPQEIVEINGELPDQYEKGKEEEPQFHPQTAALAKELKLDYKELVGKFSLEKQELFSPLYFSVIPFLWF
jgi:hypothetical protein